MSFLLENVPWTDSTCPRTVVDIGGSLGAIGIKMLDKFPPIQSWVVQDMESVIKRAAIPVEQSGRLRFSSHDLFSPQTILGAGVYFLRSVLHNWGDGQAIKILQNQVAAMDEGSRIILNEICLPKPGVLTNYQEQALRYTCPFFAVSMMLSITANANMTLEVMTLP